MPISAEGEHQKLHFFCRHVFIPKHFFKTQNFVPASENVFSHIFCRANFSPFLRPTFTRQHVWLSVRMKPPLTSGSFQRLAFTHILAYRCQAGGFCIGRWLEKTPTLKLTTVIAPHVHYVTLKPESPVFQDSSYFDSNSSARVPSTNGLVNLN